MADETDDLLIKVKGDASGGVKAMEETVVASEEMERRVSKSSRKTSDSVDGTTKKVKGLGEESKRTSKSVASDFEKLTGSSKTTAAAFEKNFARSKTVGEAFDRTIRDLHVQSKALAEIYNKTGDSKFFARMKTAEADAKKLAKASAGLAETLGKDVTQGAADAESSLSGLGPVVAGVVAAFAPLIGGAISGAVLGGVGLAGLGAGIVGQLHSPMVEGALTGFETDLKNRFTDATSAFAPELEATLGALDTNMAPFWASLKAAFTDLAPSLKILGDGFARFMNEFGPGIEAAFKGAEPVLAMIAYELPQLGQALTRFFEELNAGSTGAAESIGYLFQFLETAIVATGAILHDLSIVVEKVTGGFIRVLDVLGHLPDKLGGEKFRTAAKNLRDFQATASGAKPVLDGLQGSIVQTNDAVEKQTEAVNALHDAWASATDAFLSYDNAQLRAIEASQAFSKSLKDNGRDWDMTHTKGQANWHSLLQNIQAQKDLYDADVKVHGVTLANTTAYQKSIDKLLAQAAAAGLSKDQIDKLRLQFENLGQTLDKLNGRKVTFTVQGNIAGVLPGGVRGSIASVLANSGVHRFANSGVAGEIPHFDLTGIYSGRPGGLYRFAEESTVEEALIARNGDPGRAASALDTAASWQGATVVRGGTSATYSHSVTNNISRGGGGGGPTMLYATIVMDSKPVARALVPAVQRANGRSSVSTLG